MSCASVGSATVGDWLIGRGATGFVETDPSLRPRARIAPRGSSTMKSLPGFLSAAGMRARKDLAVTEREPRLVAARLEEPIAADRDAGVGIRRDHVVPHIHSCDEIRDSAIDLHALDVEMNEPRVLAVEFERLHERGDAAF